MYNVLRPINKKIKSLINDKLLKCNHERINSINKLTFCPDCGQKIDLSWLVAECSHCKTIQETKYIWGKPFSKHSKCPECKSKDYTIIRVREIKGNNHENYALVKTEVPVFKNDTRYSVSDISNRRNDAKIAKNNVAFSGLYKIKSIIN